MEGSEAEREAGQGRGVRQGERLMEGSEAEREAGQGSEAGREGERERHNKDSANGHNSL